MNRPPDFTDTWRLDCNRDMSRYQEFLRLAPHLLPQPPTANFLEDPHWREVWYCSAWLGSQLRNLIGVSEAVLRAVCHANAEKLVEGKDPWEITKRTLQDLKSVLARD